jgi:predicted RNase H-like HicB family nuclease
MGYAVVYEKAPRNYAAYVPDLPGCIATGKTRRQVELRIREAIRLYLEELRKDKLPIPKPAAWAEVVDIPA